MTKYKQKDMKPFLKKMSENIRDSFGKRNWIFHLLAIASTYIIVMSGFDWKYSLFFRNTPLANILFSAAFMGGVIPILAPLATILFAKIRKSAILLNTGFALLQAAILGSLISSFYKMLTGRVHPETINSLAVVYKTFVDQAYLYSANALNTDITHIFRFGLFRGGIFWGWPSSHTTIAFAMAFTLWILYAKNKWVKSLALVYALYIGLGISMTIHWFSDFLAGAIIGTVIGIVVGKSFILKNLPEKEKSLSS